MQTTDERNLETIPVGSLGIIPLESCKTLGEKINAYLVKWRQERNHTDAASRLMLMILVFRMRSLCMDLRLYSLHTSSSKVYSELLLTFLLTLSI